MRLNTLFKILGLTAVLALPLTLVGCDDDGEDSTDAATDGSTTDTATVDGSTVKLDAAPKLDAAGDAAGDAASTADAGDASTNG